MEEVAKRMDDIARGISTFRSSVFPSEQTMYQQLVRDGQHPKALVIACADSRVSPEHITQMGPGELFVCRNAGNIVPPGAAQAGGVAATIEYAVLALGVRDIVVCGHSDCGAMKGLCHLHDLDSMPNVVSWLSHSKAALQIVCEAYPADLDEKARYRAVAMENVVVQLQHLRSHPHVATALAKGGLTLHGWFFDLETGDLLIYDGDKGSFVSFEPEKTMPVAEESHRRIAAPEYADAPLREDDGDEASSDRVKPQDLPQAAE